MEKRNVEAEKSWRGTVTPMQWFSILAAHRDHMGSFK